MALPNDNVSMALYCDFENVALGVRDAKYSKFDIMPVLERLLLKGSIVVKKAYCDWERYKEYKAQMHEASFELIEIPHVRQSGKNSADIRLVVDALDLCYTKAHVNTFVIISGDSDFSPLVSKLRENAKYVIGVGVKNSTSDLLIANCDEFIFIDDLVRESRRNSAKREVRQALPAAPSVSGDEQLRRHEMEVRKIRAIDMVAETFEALMAERGDSGKIWASTLKQAIKRRKPDFNETYFGFRTFGNLLEEAQSRGLIEIGRDDKSGVYAYRSSSLPSSPAGGDAAALEGSAGQEEGLRKQGRGRGRQPAKVTPPPILPASDAEAEAETKTETETEDEKTSMSLLQTVTASITADQKPPRSRARRPQPATKEPAAPLEISTPAELPLPMAQAEVESGVSNMNNTKTKTKVGRKPAPRTKRPTKPKVAPPVIE